MSYNEGARIVPLGEANAILLRVAGPWAARPKMPDNYSRVLLLTEQGYRDLVFKAHDRSYLSYAELSYDFPICSDFSDLCAGDIVRESIKVGIAVRPCWGSLYYTKTTFSTPPVHERHAINIGLTVDEKVLYYEPQSDRWMNTPEDLLTLDEVRL